MLRIFNLCLMSFQLAIYLMKIFFSKTGKNVPNKIQNINRSLVRES